MTWVPRTPKRADFCGCPPCPLCFCWAGDDGLVDGMTKFTQDMLGGKSPSTNEAQVLKDAAEAIHVANLNLPDRIDAELKDADRTQHIQRQADAMLAQQRAEAERPKAKTPGPCLDEMDLSELEKPRQPERTIFLGNTAPMFLFDEIIKRQVEEVFAIKPSTFVALDTAAAIDEPVKKDAKEIQADFAREKAKERMREMVRAKR